MPTHPKGIQFSSYELLYHLGTILDLLHYAVAVLLNWIKIARKLKVGNDAIIGMCLDLKYNAEFTNVNI